MAESEIAARAAARRTELDELEEQLVRQLEQVRAERDDLVVAERVWHRMAEQLADEQAAAVPASVQVAGVRFRVSEMWRPCHAARASSSL